MPYQPAAGQAFVQYRPLNDQDRRDKECQQWFGASSDLNSRPISPRNLAHEYHRRQACHTQEAGSRWLQTNQAPTLTNGGVTTLNQGMTPPVKVEDGHPKIYSQLARDSQQYWQPKEAPSITYDTIQDQSIGTLRERLQSLQPSSAEDATRLGTMGVTAEQRVFSAQMHPGPLNYFSPHYVSNTQILQPQKFEQQELRTMSNMASSMHLQSEAFRRHYDDKARKKEEERRKAAVSVPTPVPTRTTSVMQLLSSVNKALEQKVETAELEAADELSSSESEALRAQSQQLQQDQSDANQAANQCGESFWCKYSANHPRVGCSSMTPPSSQKADSASAQPPIAEPGCSEGCLEGGEDLADRIRVCLKRSSAEEFLQMSACRPATETIKQGPGELLESPRTALGQNDPSSPEAPAVVSTARDGAKSSVDDLQVSQVSLANPRDSSAEMPEYQVFLVPDPPANEISIGLEVGAGEGDVVEKGGETAGPFGDVDLESEWEQVDDGDDDFGGDEGWSDVEGEVGDGYEERRETWVSGDNYPRFLGM